MASKLSLRSCEKPFFSRKEFLGFAFGRAMDARHRRASPSRALQEKSKVKTKYSWIVSFVFALPWSHLPRARASVGETLTESSLKQCRLCLHSLRGGSSQAGGSVTRPYGSRRCMVGVAIPGGAPAEPQNRFTHSWAKRCYLKSKISPIFYLISHKERL